MKNNTDIQHLQKKIKKFVDERNWNDAHNPKNLAMSISIEAAELMEILQWKTLKESRNISNSKEYIHFKEELADVIIYCLSMANQLNINISEIVEEKIEKNIKKYPIEKSNLKRR